MSARRKKPTPKKPFILRWRGGPLVTIIRADLWDDEAEILDRVMSAGRRRDRASAASLLLSDAVLSIKRMSPGELEAFLAGVLARRRAHFTDAEIARREALKREALRGRAA